MNSYHYSNGKESIVIDENCKYPGELAKVVSGNLGLGLSGFNDDEEGDPTCLMGSTDSQEDVPLECYNAAKAYDSGFYQGKVQTLQPNTIASWYVFFGVF